MSDMMFFGVLEMPYDLAMSNELSRMQFYGRVQDAVARIRSNEEEIAALHAEVEDKPTWEAVQVFEQQISSMQSELIAYRAEVERLRRIEAIACDLVSTMRRFYADKNYKALDQICSALSQQDRKDSQNG